MEQEIHVEKFHAKGQGLAYLDSGAKVEVLSGVPGDHLIVKLGKKRRGVFRSTIKEVLIPSADRVAPLCPHVPDCGGCSWQQVKYEAQLRAKQAVVAQLFSPFSVAPIIPSPSPWYYRNKMEFSFSQNKAGDRFLGLILAGSKGRVFNVKACYLMNTWVAPLLDAVRKWWEANNIQAYFMPRDEGALRTLILREGKKTGHKMVMLTVSGNPAFALTRSQLNDFMAAVKSVLPDEPHLSLFLRIQQQMKGSPTQFYEMHLSGPDYIEEILNVGGHSFTYKISPTSFFQPNSAQAEVIYATALSLVQNKFKKRIYDLYCGTGTLGMALSSQAEEVIGIELNPHALFDATTNLELNKVTNMRLICGDVGEKLLELPHGPDLVVIDPPRAGLSPKARALLLQCAPQEILYISCNPATQADDARFLSEGGYELTHLQPVDQFPHTVHIENIAHFRKTASFA